MSSPVGLTPEVGGCARLNHGLTTVVRWLAGADWRDHAREGVVRTGGAPSLGRKADFHQTSLVGSLTHRIARLQEPIDRRHVAFQRTKVVLLVLATEIRQYREDILVSQALDVISRAPEMMKPVLIFQIWESLEGILTCG